METSNLLNEAPPYWEIPEERWGEIQALLQKHDPPRVTGRRRIDQRAALNAMIYRARTGCRWNKMPKHLPDDSSVHRTMQRWVKLGVFNEIWQIVVTPLPDGQGIDLPPAAPSGVESVESVAPPPAGVGDLTEQAA
jgi:transposase